MPDEYPDYPSHRQLQAYFESYARTFGVHERIRFKHVVQKIMRLPAGEWRVEYQDAEGADHVEQFDVLMIANGHHWIRNIRIILARSTANSFAHDFKKVDDSRRGKNMSVIEAATRLAMWRSRRRITKKVCLSMPIRNSSSPNSFSAYQPTCCYQDADLGSHRD